MAVGSCPAYPRPVQPSRHLELLAARADALIRAAAGAMRAPVPSCPGWTEADLVAHMGAVWAWAADVVRTRRQADRTAPPAQETDDAMCDWARRGAERLVASLGAADPDEDCWTFGPPRSVRFWFRRQALETTLHAWDAQAATGAPERIDADVAADGVDEHLFVVVPRSVRAHPGAWSGETVHLHCTDAEGEWTVRLGPDGTVETQRTHSKAELALRGGAESLWLWCANRATAASLGIECFGSAELAERWQREMRF